MMEYDQFTWIVFSSRYYHREASSFLLLLETNIITVITPLIKYLRDTYILGTSDRGYEVNKS